MIRHNLEHFLHHLQAIDDEDNTFTQTNLVADLPNVAAQTDPNLVNAWGISHAPTGPFWVSDNGTGVVTLYDGLGQPQSAAGHSTITIAVPPGQTEHAAPTGQVFNDTHTGFNITDHGKTASSVFLFATEDGTISGWNPKVNGGSSILAVDHSAAGDVFKGLALGHDGDKARLFAADFRHDQVEVFDDKFHEIKHFTDPSLPQNFAPFNVQVLNDKLFVTFAMQDMDKHDDVAGHGNGFVDEFDLHGHLLLRIASQGTLNSPWGMAIAPKGFGEFANDLLVGNFGDGKINAFDPLTGRFEGQLHDTSGNPLVIPGLWALTPGDAAANADPSKIYFTAGPGGEQHGLFGSLQAAPDAAPDPLHLHHHVADGSLMV
jgi:uncharacterized protein (TIGR03118 family)